MPDKRCSRSDLTKGLSTQRLKEMKETGLMSRELISERPIAVSYSITRFGKTALEVLEGLSVKSNL